MQLSAIPVSQSQVNPTTVNIQSNTQTVVIKTEPTLSCSEKRRVVKTTASSKLSLAKMVRIFMFIRSMSLADRFYYRF